jgi:hypothetical protein
VREEDDLRPAHVLEPGTDLIGIRRLAPGVAEVRELAAVDLRLRGESLAEEAMRDHEHRIARRYEVLEDRLHRARSRRGQMDDVVLRAEDLLQPLGHALERAAEVRRAVVDHRRRRGCEHLWGHRRRAGRHEVALLRHLQ